jgi:hypothetical protein
MAFRPVGDDPRRLSRRRHGSRSDISRVGTAGHPTHIRGSCGWPGWRSARGRPPSRPAKATSPAQPSTASGPDTADVARLGQGSSSSFWLLGLTGGCLSRWCACRQRVLTRIAQGTSPAASRENGSRPGRASRPPRRALRAAFQAPAAGQGCCHCPGDPLGESALWRRRPRPAHDQPGAGQRSPPGHQRNPPAARLAGPGPRPPPLHARR